MDTLAPTLDVREHGGDDASLHATEEIVAATASDSLLHELLKAERPLDVPQTGAEGEVADPQELLIDSMLDGQDFSTIEMPAFRGSQRSSSRRAANDDGNASMFSATNAADLFGTHFHALRNELSSIEQIPDPEELDTWAMMRATFGSYYERMIDIEPAAPEDTVLDQLTREARLEDAHGDLKDLFGVAVARRAVDQTSVSEDVAAALRTDEASTLGILGATVPDVLLKSREALASLRPTSSSNSHRDKLWLMEMSHIDPNRQTLHADPTICVPSDVKPLQSSDRRLFTTQNIMRWSYTAKTATPVSNTRLIRWSDGTWTLHVGSDVFEVAPSASNALSALVAPNRAYIGTATASAMTAVQGFDERVVAKVLNAPSIRDALVVENMRHRATDVQRRLGVPTDPVMPEIDVKRPKNERSQLETFVMLEREQRQKELLERAKSGNPMTLAEQIMAEQSMFARLRSATAQELAEEQEAEARKRALQTHSGRRATTAGRGRRTDFNGDAATESWEDVAAQLGGNGTETVPQRSRSREAAEGTDEVEAPTSSKRRRLDHPAAAAVESGSSLTEVVSERREYLSRLRERLPAVSNVGQLVDSLLSMDSILKGSASGFAKELEQIVADISEELGPNAVEWELFAPYGIAPPTSSTPAAADL